MRGVVFLVAMVILALSPLGSRQSAAQESPTQLEWTLDGEPAGTDPEVTLAGVAPGEHTMKLVATAGDGRTAQSESRLDVQADGDGLGLIRSARW